MKSQGQETYVQCQNCGKIYIIQQKVNIESSIIHSKCPRCEEYVGLNLGENIEDIYEYYNVNLDNRYY